jgi:hypothetical protein
MTPDYSTGECQFAFGKAPTEEEERLARETPCLMRCPSGGSMRGLHGADMRGNVEDSKLWLEDLRQLSRLNETNNQASDNLLVY